MTAANPFDAIASSYDDDFTHSQIGRMQRRIVWDYLETWLAQTPKPHILELNCGTGADAKWLTSRGATVLATDYSDAMVSEANAKLEATDSKAMVLDVKHLEQIIDQGPFDLVFSNFGGLNCLSPQEMEDFAELLPRLLRPNGRFMAVVMPNFCAWETTYFLAKAQVKKAFRRRQKQAVIADLGTTQVATWYYGPKQFTQFFGAFRQIKTLPVGIFIPPSYLEPFFKSRTKMLNRLQTLDEHYRSNSQFAKLADHFLVDLQLRSQ
ncbi:MAG: class I SAM-dependent methyltransferase [Bacteroidota bacterium]